ncbi:PQQ-dependent sugar dehydrogenase [Euzebya pacifica]|uniref:PQQ-dependent sugar dehydrogenase n=1 Tax=Euzebya pacifica TaxID=1608957 RepID=UPI0030FBE786
MTSTRTTLLVLVAVLAMVVPLGTAASAQSLLPDPSVDQEVLYGELISPTALEVAPDGRVIVTSREGQVTVWEQDGTVTRAAFLPVDAYDRQGGQFDVENCPRGEECPAGFNLAEGGIHGILLAPDFMTSGELYLYYTVANSLGMEPWPPKMPNARPFCDDTAGDGCPASGNDEGIWRLSRFTMDLDANTIDLSTEVPLFENPAEWFYCCHYGGDMEWRNDGTLLLSTGDDTTSDHSSGYSPHDQRADWTFNSAALTSANPADRRGKVLRIDVEELESGLDGPLGDGVPGDRAGIDPNPFVDDPDADPYVYAYGFRSLYRFGYSPETDHVYAGNVGPDARNPDPTRGPAAHDEIEVVPPGGGTNHGWPFCIADNVPYNEYDFATGAAGEPFSCAGMTPAAVWYTYVPSTTSPYVQMGGGGNTALGGVAYHRPDNGALRLPEAYDDHFLWMEYSRGAVWHMPIADDGSLDNSPASLNATANGIPFVLPGLSNPIDMATGPDGAVYVVESNGGWNSISGRLTRLQCAGCTPDAADYGNGVEILDRPAVASVAGVDGGLASVLPTAGLLGLVLVALGGLGVRRRRRVI